MAIMQQQVVSHIEWLKARTQFLEREKQLTHLRDALARERRELPWERVEKDYRFENAEGKHRLNELFDGSGQLIVYHFMLGPGWAEGCPSCSFLADQFDAMRPHLSARDYHLLLVGIAAVAFCLTWLALRVRPMRWLVALAAVQLVVLAASPSYFGYYSGYAAAAIALTVAAGIDGARRLALRLALTATTLTTSIALTSVAFVHVPITIASKPFPHAAVAKALGHLRCPMTDAPIVLIETNRLSDTLASGCPNWIDIAGRVYDIDRPPAGYGARATNQRWQDDLHRYLFSSPRVVLMHPALGIGRPLRQEINSLPLIYHHADVYVYAVPARQRTTAPH